MDGQTYDVARVALVVTLFVFLGLAIANYDKFDPLAFGGGVGALIVGTGVAVGAKAKTEPKGDQEDV